MTHLAHQSEDDFEREQVHPWLETAGWDVINAEDSPPQTRDTYQRTEDEAIFWDIVDRNLQDINNISSSQSKIILDDIKREMKGKDLMNTNRDIINILRRGSTYKDPNDDYDTKSYDVIDLDDIDNNEFKAIRQFTYKGEQERRPDVVLFVNGLPLVVIEVKNNFSSRNPTATKAIKDLKYTYEEELPELFYSNVFNVALTQTELRYGAIESDMEHYHYWKKDTSEKLSGDIDKQFKDLVNPERILDILADFVFYKSLDESSSKYVKIIPRHQQYFAVKRILSDIENKESDGELARELIVHVQGSGKTYAMIFAANILTRRQNYPVYIVVDERKLIKQFGKDLRKIEEIQENIIDSSKGAKSGSEQLKEAVQKSKPEVILTIIHLFNELNADREDIVQSDTKNVLFADEAHRFLEDILGSMMEKTLNNFHYYGFTGTPIESTFEEFNDELHRYSMGDAIEEEAILPVDMNSKRDRIRWDFDEDVLDRRFEQELDFDSEVNKYKVINEALGTEELASLDERMNIIVDDIVDHYRNDLRSGALLEKGMVVTKGKRNAAKYGQKLQNKLGKDVVDVIYSESKDDPPFVRQFHKSDEKLDNVIDRFEDPDELPNLIVVCDMLRTGFDAPVVRTIYLDREFKSGHTLLQTIARTNRPREGKEFGEIIDYQGGTENFEDLVDYEKEEIDEFTSKDRERFKQEFKTQLNLLYSMFESHKPSDFTLSDPSSDELLEFTKDLNGHNKQNQFENEFKRLENLYDNIQPDEFVVDYYDEYRTLKGIYQLVKTQNKVTIGEDTTQELLTLLQEEVTVTEKNAFNETRTRVEKVDRDHPLKITKKQDKLRAILRKQYAYDPRYKKLSERVKSIISRWDQDELSNSEVADRLDNVENDLKTVSEEMVNDDLTKYERSIKATIEEYVPETEDKEELAKDIVQRFDTDKPEMKDWWKNTSRRDRVLSESILPVIYRYVDDLDLFMENEDIILDEISRYLIEKEQ